MLHSSNKLCVAPSKASIISLVIMFTIYIEFTALTANGEIFRNSTESGAEVDTATSRELESPEVDGQYWSGGTGGIESGNL